MRLAKKFETFTPPATIARSTQEKRRRKAGDAACITLFFGGDKRTLPSERPEDSTIDVLFFNFIQGHDK